MKFTMLMINKGVYNHPSKRFARENFKEVAARKGIHGAMSAWLWRGAKGAWWWCFKNEATMLVYRVVLFELQSQCLTGFPSPTVLCLSRFVMEDHGCIPIVIENNTMWARKKRMMRVARASSRAGSVWDKTSL